ncbi:hypothetical protein TrCOL_g7026 [Triparma columacea]|uniref:DNA-directed RNA polymerase n=1 Tax=Triparma columacea TaxID=722753 RepID=A0A9W7G5T0_9STRA|nr:hypothetical protein TrCOL_g7026 [Triparma columacea]
MLNALSTSAPSEVSPPTAVPTTPAYGDPNDPRLGNLQDISCPGYFGHVELACPVYHQGFIDMVLKSLRCVCYHCSSLVVGDISNDFKVKKASSITKRKTRLEAMHNTLRNKAGKQCDHCGRHQPPAIGGTGYGDLQEIVKDEDARKLGLDIAWAKPEWLVVSVLPVPPLHVRPSIHAGGNTSEDDLTHQLINVVKSNIALKDAIATGAPYMIQERRTAPLRSSTT